VPTTKVSTESGDCHYSPVLRTADLPADTTVPWWACRDSASTSPDPGVDTAARKSTLPRESTKLHEELQALGIVRLARQRLGQPTAIQRLLPSMSLCAPSLETSSVQTNRRLPCRVLAGVTAEAAVSTYGVWMLPRSKEPVMRVFVAGATGAIGKQLAPRLAAGEAGAVLMTELRGASNARAKRELAWRPAQPGWRQGFTAA